MGIDLPLQWALPSATDLVAVNTFDPDGGLGPQESNPAPSVLAALLPNQQKNPSAESPTHIGEGLPPVPARLAAKIFRVFPLGPGTNGIHDLDHLGQPGVRGIGVGSLRRSVQAAGHGAGQNGMVPCQSLSLRDLFYGQDPEGGQV